MELLIGFMQKTTQWQTRYLTIPPFDLVTGKAMKHEPPLGNGKWQLYNIVNDPGENVNLADQHPDILQRLISAYETYAKDVGIVIPRGESYYEALTTAAPPLNQSQMTISSEDITPVQFSQANRTFL
jgi:hypothetical protein